MPFARRALTFSRCEIEGRKIAKTFWGEAWCDHLESFSDYANRLPRGRTYVRNGSVCHLAIEKGQIEAKVSGSELYNLRIEIKTLPGKKWEAVKQRCAGQIGSLIELLQGQSIGPRDGGRHRSPARPVSSPGRDLAALQLSRLGRHVQTCGGGSLRRRARLDEKPELLFTLRGVNHEDLLAAEAEMAVSRATSSGKSKRLATDQLSDVFGVDIDAASARRARRPGPPRSRLRSGRRIESERTLRRWKRRRRFGRGGRRRL